MSLLEKDVPMWKRFSLERKIVRNSNLNASLTLNRNDKVKYCIRRRPINSLALCFWVKSGFNFLCDFT